MNAQTASILAGQNAGTPELLPLNLIVDYPVKWDRFKVLRDFLQNFYDAVGHANWSQRFSYQIEDDRLILKAADVDFSYDWLVHIGASTKRDAPGTYAGFFGEGFKIASLCALRDHGWNVEMASRDWTLQVTKQNIVIDDRNVSSLAYRIWKGRPRRCDTALVLYPFRGSDIEELQIALNSFYYAENPLFGDQIWSTEKAAVWRRSNVPKPRGFPSTFSLNGEGILFVGYQAMGSFQFPLIIALHDFRHYDRERHSFYEMDVVDVLKRVCSLVPAACAIQLLEAFRRKWYSYPKDHYDPRSWHPIIARLTERVSQSATDLKLWRDRHPQLLVAERVKRSQLPQSNRRRQALAWLRQDRPKCRLVQDGFFALGYERLEDACERAGGFVSVRLPTPKEAAAIRLLQELTDETLNGFFGNNPLPPCRVIERETACWQGMAVCQQLGEPIWTKHGRRVSYRLPYIALKKSAFCVGGFASAWSTYLHELGHCFGGDQSAHFSQALTDMLQATLLHSQTILRAKAEWDACHELPEKD